jgi:mannose-6-phosphate isomerase-like protein (cupin superfamily)
MVSRYIVGTSDNRPWGRWKVTDVGQCFAVKTIKVHPGMRSSLQYHDHRTEYWTVVEGEGMAEIAGKETVLCTGASVVIPAKTLHRLTNTGHMPLTIIEIQTGELLDEADITRVEDDYGRV